MSSGRAAEWAEYFTDEHMKLVQGNRVFNPEMELFTLLHLFLPDSYWTPGILPDWTRTGTNFMLADHHTNFVSQS